MPPAPGKGPSPESQKRGLFDLRFLGKTAHGNVIRQGRGDADSRVSLDFENAGSGGIGAGVGLSLNAKRRQQWAIAAKNLPVLDGQTSAAALCLLLMAMAVTICLG